MNFLFIYQFVDGIYRFVNFSFLIAFYDKVVVETCKSLHESFRIKEKLLLFLNWAIYWKVKKPGKHPVVISLTHKTDTLISDLTNTYFWYTGTVSLVVPNGKKEFKQLFEEVIWRKRRNFFKNLVYRPVVANLASTGNVPEH